MGSRSRVGSVVVLSLLFSACSGSPDDERTGAAADLLIADAALSSRVAVSSDRLTVEAPGHEHLLARRPGSYILGAPGGETSANPTGFLRKVKNVSAVDGKIVFDTEEASLAEVAKE